MTPTQQRALTGTAAGAGVGAIFGLSAAMPGLVRGSVPALASSAGCLSINLDAPRMQPSSKDMRPAGAVVDRPLSLREQRYVGPLDCAQG